MKPRVRAFFDEATYTISYVVAEPEGSHCAIVNSVLNYDPKSGRTWTTSADEIIAYVRQEELTVDWILETHAHADHVTAAPYLRRELGGQVGIGRHITDVQEVFSKVFNFEPTFTPDGRQFDKLFDDGDTFDVGDMTIEVMHTPGHTPACVVYVAGDAAFVGDTIFMPDFGSARTDFPGGDAATLYRSVRRLLSLPPQTRLFMCHDYGPGGREYQWETTVAQERAENIHVHDGVDEAEFVKMRTERDAKLSMPVLILPAIQINIRAGEFPPADDNGTSYLKLPLNAL